MISPREMRILAITFVACIVILAFLLAFEVGYHAGWRDALAALRRY